MTALRRKHVLFISLEDANPSRASRVMGLRPETTGVYGNFDGW